MFYHFDTSHANGQSETKSILVASGGKSPRMEEGFTVRNHLHWLAET
jgi:hypothetical protein